MDAVIFLATPNKRKTCQGLTPPQFRGKLPIFGHNVNSGLKNFNNCTFLCTNTVQSSVTTPGETLANNPFESIQRKVNEMLKAQGLPNLENPVTQLIRQGLQEMEFVSLEDFEVQREVLNRLREKVHALELRVAELEKRTG